MHTPGSRIPSRRPPTGPSPCVSSRFNTRHVLSHTTMHYTPRDAVRIYFFLSFWAFLHILVRYTYSFFGPGGSLSWTLVRKTRNAERLVSKISDRLLSQVASRPPPLIDGARLVRANEARSNELVNPYYPTMVQLSFFNSVILDMLV